MAVSRLAYSAEEAAESVGKGVKVIYAAIKRGELIARYVDSQPMIEPEAIRDWLGGLATEKPERAA